MLGRDVRGADDALAHEPHFHAHRGHAVRLAVAESVEAELLALEALRRALVGLLLALDLRGLVVREHDSVRVLIDAVPAPDHRVVRPELELEVTLGRERDALR